MSLRLIHTTCALSLTLVVGWAGIHPSSAHATEDAAPSPAKESPTPANESPTKSKTEAKKDAPNSLDAQVTAWRSADTKHRSALALKLAARDPIKLQDALKAAPRGTVGAGTAGEIVEWTYTSKGDREHTMYLAVPESYSPEKPMPMLLWLHGAVMRPSPNMGQGGISYFADKAEEEGFLLLSPSAAGIPWWTEEGVQVIRDALRYVADRYHVDADRIAASGFSDGASGCYHLMQHMSEPFCCFIPLLGHPVITRVSGGPAFKTNVRSRPVFAVHAGEDQLYPSSKMEPWVESIREAGADIKWLDLPEERHSPAAFKPRWAKWAKYWNAHPRTGAAKKVSWETAAPALTGRFDCVEILSVRPGEEDDAEPDVLPVPDGAAYKPRPKLGVVLDREYDGKGLRVSSVSKGSAAANGGIQEGDVLVAVDDEALESMADMRKLAVILQKLNEEEEDGEFHLLRDEKEVVLSLRPRVLKSEQPGFGYGKPSGKMEATFEPDNHVIVTSTHVTQGRIHLRGPHIDFSKPVKVTLNGKVVWNALVPRLASYMLAEDARALGTSAHPFVASILLTP